MSHENEIEPLATRLIAGQDFPANYSEFRRMFPDNDACLQYLRKLRWPDTFICPSCGIKKEAWTQTRNRLVCSSCRHQTSITTNTIFDKTRIPLTKWFKLAWHMTTAKFYFSATTYQQELEISYRTVWVMMQRYRVAMSHSNRNSLTGTVEIDKVPIRETKHDKKQGHDAPICIVAIAVEIAKSREYGRILMRYIPDTSIDNLIPFIQEMVEPGATISTVDLDIYNDLSKCGYKHKRVVLPNSSEQAYVGMSGVQSIAESFKQWIQRTYHGSFNPEHLQAYLEEFTFRFNQGKSPDRGLAFRTLLEHSVAIGSVTDKDLTQGYSWSSRREIS